MNNEKYIDEIGVIDLKAFFLEFIKNRYLILASGVLASALFFIFSLFLSNEYKAEIVLAPAISDNQNADNLGNFGNLASFAGINISSSSVNKKDIALEMIRSKAFIIDFIKEYKLEPIIIAQKKWDEDKQQIYFNETMYDAEKNVWKRNSFFDYSYEPSDLDLHKEFSKMMTISENSESGIVKVTFSHISPVLAKEILDKMVYTLNQSFKQQDIDKAKTSITFLEEQIENTNLDELRSTLFELVQSQIQTIMLAEANPEYIFQTIDPPFVPEEHSDPNRIFLALLGLLIGVFGSLVFIFSPKLLK